MGGIKKNQGILSKTIHQIKKNSKFKFIEEFFLNFLVGAVVEKC